MARYILRRAFSPIITSIVISGLTFWLMHSVPGGHPRRTEEFLRELKDKRLLAGWYSDYLMKVLSP